MARKVTRRSKAPPETPPSPPPKPPRPTPWQAAIQDDYQPAKTRRRSAELWFRDALKQEGEK